VTVMAVWRLAANIVAVLLLLATAAHGSQLSSVIPSRQARRQCFTTRALANQPGDRIDNPVFGAGGFHSSTTLQNCVNICAHHQTLDNRGRRCVAIEWSDQGRSLPSSAQRNCALAWSCTHTQSWGGGSVFVLSSFAPTNAATSAPSSPGPTTPSPTAWYQSPSVPNVTDMYRRLQSAERLVLNMSTLAASQSSTINSMAAQMLADSTQTYVTFQSMNSTVQTLGGAVAATQSTVASAVAGLSTAQAGVAAAHAGVASTAAAHTRLAADIRSAVSGLPQLVPPRTMLQSPPKIMTAVGGNVVVNASGAQIDLGDLVRALTSLGSVQ